jgi:integrase
MKLNQLSVKFVEKVKKPGRHNDGGGLVLVVTPSGSKNWQYRYETSGRGHYMGFGPFPLVSLAEARDKRDDARRQRLNRIDPMEARAEQRAREVQERRQRISFMDATRQFFALHGSQWKAKHRGQFTSTLEHYAFPVLGAMYVDAIKTEDVLRVLEPIWSSKTATAVRTRGRIEKVLAWAIVRGLRQPPNPAAWKGHLQAALPAPSLVAKPEHHAALPYSELPGFMALLHQKPGFVTAALQLLILTASRTNEIVGMRWAEVDIENAVWVVPAERMKRRKEHRVPLSVATLSLLQSLPREADYVFVGAQPNKPINNLSMAALLRRMGFESITVHGFRSSFSDWAHETSVFSNHVIEQALSHAVGSQVERAYRRGSMFFKRRQLMDQWSAYCIGGQP